MLRVVYSFPACSFYNVFYLKFLSVDGWTLHDARCSFCNAFQWRKHNRSNLGANDCTVQIASCKNLTVTFDFLNFWHFYTFVLSVSLQVCYKRVNWPLTAFQPAIFYGRHASSRRKAINYSLSFFTEKVKPSFVTSGIARQYCKAEPRMTLSESRVARWCWLLY